MMIVAPLPHDPEAEARGRAMLDEARVACGLAPLDEVEIVARKLRRFGRGEAWPRSPLRTRVRARARVEARIAARVDEIEALFASADAEFAHE